MARKISCIRKFPRPRGANVYYAVPYTDSLTGRTSRTIFPWLASLLFISLSVGFIPYAGIQEDEALFSVPFFERPSREFRVRLLHHDIPLMVMTYVGALKTWIFWPLIHWFGPSAWTVRLPVVLIGGITVFIFYYLMIRLGIPRSFAAAGALLLATDPVFILTNTFDWGPVAIEHVLLVAGCLLLVRFCEDPSNLQEQSKLRFLGWGFFCFGLALWNKALFLWALSGLIVATILVCRRELARHLTWPNLRVAALSMIVGALPFVIYNLRNADATVSDNAHIDLAHMPSKWLQLQRAADGSSLFGFMSGEDSDGSPKPAASRRGRFAQWIWRHTGDHRETGFLYVLGVMLILVPLWWRSRTAWFSLVFVAVAWGMMAITRNAGAAAHHDILLWPFPILFAVSVLASVAMPRTRRAISTPWRWAGLAVAVAMIAMNLLVVNQYVVQFERDGGAENFTDALFALDRALPENQTVYIIDWGMNATTQLAHMGRLHEFAVFGLLRGDSPSPEQQGQLAGMLADRNAVWLDHVTAREEFAGMGANLDRFASAAGYRKETFRTVDDSNGRPVFELFHYVPLPDCDTAPQSACPRATSHP